jgi:hypothetical protein
MQAASETVGGFGPSTDEDGPESAAAEGSEARRRLPEDRPARAQELNMPDPDSPASYRLSEDGVLTVADRSGHGGLLYLLRTCGNPQCDCREMMVRVLPLEALESGREDFDSEASLRLRIDFDFGAVLAEDGSDVDYAAHPSLATLRDALDRELLEKMARQWHREKGRPIDEKHFRPDIDLSSWRPGQKVTWSEVYPQPRQDRYYLDEKVYLAEDQYCVEPSCSCDEVTFVFYDLKGPERRVAGAVHMTLASGKVRFEPRLRCAETIRKLWTLFTERNRGSAFWQRRLERMKEYGRHLQLHSPAARREAPRVGRNDPCPCGSGKKLKRCCLVRATLG